MPAKAEVGGKVFRMVRGSLAEFSTMEHSRASRRASPSCFQFSQRQGYLHLCNGFEKGIQSLTVVDVWGWYLFQLTREISFHFQSLT